jgi:hypothetical protein
MENKIMSFEALYQSPATDPNQVIYNNAVKNLNQFVTSGQEAYQTSVYTAVKTLGETNPDLQGDLVITIADLTGLKINYILEKATESPKPKN